MSNNSPSNKKIEKALGISKINDLDEMDDFNEEEQKKKLEERKESIASNKKLLETLKKNSGKDEDFIREMLKDVAMSGMTIVKVLEEEMQLDVKARNVETAAEMMNAVTAALGKLQSISEHDDKMGLEKEKLEIKKNSGDVPNITNNIIASGTMTELLDSFKKSGVTDIGIVDTDVVEVKENNKTIDVKADVIIEKDEKEESDN